MKSELGPILGQEISLNNDSTVVSCDKDKSHNSRVNSIQSFSPDAILDELLDILKDKGVIEDLSEADLRQIRDEASERIRSKFPEFDSVGRLRENFNRTVEQPSEIFEGSSLSLVEYIREHFGRAILDQYLPVDLLQEDYLRRRIYLAKKQGRLPKEIADACVTKGEFLDENQSCFKVLIGDDEKRTRNLSRCVRPRPDNEPK